MKEYSTFPKAPAAASSSDCLMSYLGLSFGGRVLPLCRDAVGVFYSPRLGWACVCVFFKYSYLIPIMLYSHMLQLYIYSYICWIHTDAMNNRRAKTSLKKYVPLILLLRLCVRGSWRPNKDYIILTPALMAVVSFSFNRAAQTESQGPSSLLDDGFLYCILSPTGLQTPPGVPGASSAGYGFPYHFLSPTSLIPNSLGAPRAPSAGLSLPHLISNFSRPQHWLPTQSGAPKAPKAECGFPYHISSLTSSDL